MIHDMSYKSLFGMPIKDLTDQVIAKNIALKNFPTLIASK